MMVFRKLQQFVPEFDEYTAKNGRRWPEFAPGGDSAQLTDQEGAELFGARMVGRWKSVRSFMHVSRVLNKYINHRARRSRRALCAMILPWPRTRTATTTLTTTSATTRRSRRTRSQTSTVRSTRIHARLCLVVSILTSAARSSRRV